MTRPRRKMTQLCDACGTSARRGRYRQCPNGCGARLHTLAAGPCSDAHAPICPNHQPHPEALEDNMTDPPDITDQDIRNVAYCIDLLAADAAIEDALNPKPLLDPETIDLIHMGLDSGDPVKVGATHILLDMYKVGLFGEEASRG